jgi:hypothetical protein
MAELRSAIFWVLCPKQSLHCYKTTPQHTVWGKNKKEGGRYALILFFKL